MQNWRLQRWNIGRGIRSYKDADLGSGMVHERERKVRKIEKGIEICKDGELGGEFGIWVVLVCNIIRGMERCDDAELRGGWGETELDAELGGLRVECCEGNWLVKR
jgi:hypothetical protein